MRQQSLTFTTYPCDSTAFISTYKQRTATFSGAWCCFRTRFRAWRAGVVAPRIVVINRTSGGTISNNESSVLSNIGSKHFVAYVLGAANDRRLNDSNTSVF